MLAPPLSYNLLIRNNNLSNNILISNVAFTRQEVEIRDKDKLSRIELIKAFQTYKVFIAITIRDLLTT